MGEHSEFLPDLRPLHPAPVISGDDEILSEFRYRRPQGLDFHLLVFTLEGEASIGPLNGKLQQRVGDFILIDPHKSIDQDVAGKKNWHRLWFIFDPKPQWHDWLDWPELASGFRQIHVPSVHRNSDVRERLNAAHSFASGTLRRRGELAMNALEAALLWCDAYNPRSKEARLDPRVVGAMDFVSLNFRDRLTLEQIAAAAESSVPHLVRLFRKALELSPMQFVERHRMQRASELLQMTSQSVSDIAAAVGFDDPFYFSTRFKRYSGKSPRAYRGQDRRNA